MENFITELQTLQAEHERIEAKLAEYYKPVLDVSYAQWLRERVQDRDVYLMLALRFFSPRSLVGGRLIRNKYIRDVICENIGVNKWYVSRQIKEVVSLYSLVKPFRKRVNKAYDCISKELEAIKTEKR